MMYSNHLAVAVRVGNKVLRENNGEVSIPFGTEYSIRIKNINSVKAKVKVFIDGQNMTDGELVINPNSTLDLERSIKGGNLSKGHKFKFIERTEEIENHRGIEVDDGLIRVEYSFAKKVVDVPEIRKYPVYEPDYYYPWWPYRPYRPRPWWDNGIYWGDSGTNGCAIGGLTQSAQTVSGVQQGAQNMMCSMSMNCTETSLSDAGITVEGGISNQQFYTVDDFATDSSHVLVLKLKGYKAAKNEPLVTTKFKPKCPTCGRVNKAVSKFCTNCGTSLQTIA